MPVIPMPGTSAFKAYLRSTGSTAAEGGSAYAAQQRVIPPVGTSAYKAYSYTMKNGVDLPLSFQALYGNTPSEPPQLQPAKRSPSSASAVAYSAVPPSVFDYLNADLAEHYGMSKPTAYQEALSNTSYQRAVQDMRAAGLNPAVMFGSGRASGANASTYASEASSGSGDYGRRRSGGSSGNGKLFDSSTYGAIAAIGGMLGIAATGRPDGFWIGSQTAQGAMQLMNAVNKSKK